jgi:hypothetical protein
LLVLYVLLAAGALLVWRAVLRRIYPTLDEIGRGQAVYLDRLPSAWQNIAILFSAAVSLFLELALIRWQGTILPIFAFYKNYSLLVCFAGLGLGYSLARRESIPLLLSIPLLAVQFVLLTVLRHGPDLEAVWQVPFREQLSMGLSVSPTIWPFMIAIYSFLAVVFLLTVVAFIPIGQLCGRLMSRRENLEAYGFNLLGSILGVALLSGISFLWTPPAIWFCLAFAMILPFLRFDLHAFSIGAFGTIAALVVLDWPVSPGVERIYSPYQLLERGRDAQGLTSILAAGHYYQRVLDLSSSHVGQSEDPHLKAIAAYYALPYRILGRQPERVAVVGAGTGNDVAAALRSGAGHVDAIEIDPAILALGHQYHPEHPYDDPRVTAVVNDARTFMRSTANRYDMIVYGLLDSHTLLSHASSIRLDSFVYTVEGLREARAHLKENGLISLSFSVLSGELGRKLFRMMQEAFDGRSPICVSALYDGSAIFLMSARDPVSIAPELLTGSGFSDVSATYGNPAIAADVSTDDWPFFYMPRRVYPTSYLMLMGLILGLSLLTTTVFFSQKPVFGTASFFFLGAGFMLVETKAITEMGLVFGNTWHVIGIVILGILVMAFSANVFVQRFQISTPAAPFVMLIATLLGGYFITRHIGFGSSPGGKLGAVVLLTCPMFFSGIVFSTLLQRAQDIAAVMAINLLGSMFGGILEYNSMYFGFSFLYLLAAGIYVLAFASGYVKARDRA